MSDDEDPVADDEFDALVRDLDRMMGDIAEAYEAIIATIRRAQELSRRRAHIPRGSTGDDHADDPR